VASSSVEFPDLPDGIGQVGVIRLRSHLVFFGLGEEAANRNGFSKNAGTTSSGCCPSSTHSGNCRPRRLGRM
jgi:hypothetical protein